MRHAWIDASAGVAGDMLLGALLDAGADLGTVQAAVDAVVPDSVAISVAQVTRAGLRATKAAVEVVALDQSHRRWATVRTLIDDADLPAPVRRSARAVFSRLAQAEGRVHGIDPEQVHFHEVGALDSIADVVGVCAALHDLRVDSVSAAPVALGAGTVRTAHGTSRSRCPPCSSCLTDGGSVPGAPGSLPPPPAWPWWLRSPSPVRSCRLCRCTAWASGRGTRDPAGRANVTRVVLGDLVPAADPTSSAVLLETNVDDLDPRLWPEVLSRLLRLGSRRRLAGADPGQEGPARARLECADPPGSRRRPAGRDAGGDQQLRRTGDRLPQVRPPAVLVRRPARGDVTVAVKVAHRDGVIRRVTPEFESVAAAAATLGHPQHDVLTAATGAARATGLVAGAALPGGGRSTMTP